MIGPQEQLEIAPAESALLDSYISSCLSGDPLILHSVILCFSVSKSVNITLSGPEV